MIWLVFKHAFSIILLLMLILFYFKIDNRKIFLVTSGLLVAYIPLRRLLRHVEYNDSVKNFIDSYPILDIVDLVIPVLILIMTVAVANKYKKYKSLNNE